MNAPRAVLWPANVPSSPDAHRLLCGHEPLPAELSLVTQDLLRSLDPLERGALRIPLETPSALRDALLVRWRLAVALDLAEPAAGAALDSDALNVLLAGADRALDGLRAEAPGPDADPTGALARSREALLRDALALSTRGVTGASAAFTPAPRPRPLPPEPITRNTVFHPAQASASARRRKQALAVGLMLAVGLAAALHGPGLLERPAPLPTLPGAPEGLSVVPLDATGQLLVRTVAAAPLSGEQRQWLERQRTERGLEPRPLSGGTFLLVRAVPSGEGATR